MQTSHPKSCSKFWGSGTMFKSMRLPNDEVTSERPAVGLPFGSRSEVVMARRPSGCV